MYSAKVRSSAPGGAEPSDASVLVRLRRATAETHRRVEARLFPAALADRGSYAGMLEILLALHEPIETRLSALPDLHRLGIEPRARRKSPLLRADLAALGIDPPPAAHPAEAWPHDLPEALGAFYVLEGSTLGGRVLLDQVRTRLGDAPTRFLAGYGDATGRYWRRTRAALVEAIRSDSDPIIAAERLVASAGATFQCLEMLLDVRGWA